MRANEFTAREIVNELDPYFVNQQVNKQDWKILGQGLTASVWQHMMDPDVVVKLVGGGDEPATTDKVLTGSIAFVDFLVHYGYKSKHLPIVYGINVDDPDIVQIKIERLLQLPYEVARALSTVASVIKYSRTHESQREDNEYLQKELIRNRLTKTNNVNDITDTIRLLFNKEIVSAYKNKYGLAKIQLDLHSGNWLMRPDKTIVAADPWFAY